MEQHMEQEQALSVKMRMKIGPVRVSVEAKGHRISRGRVVHSAGQGPRPPRAMADLPRRPAASPPPVIGGGEARDRAGRFGRILFGALAFLAVLFSSAQAKTVHEKWDTSYRFVYPDCAVNNSLLTENVVAIHWPDGTDGVAQGPILPGGRFVVDCSAPLGAACNATHPAECSSPVFAVVPGRTYRFRIGSLTSLPSLSLQIEGHPMTVVETDGHSVKPFVVKNRNDWLASNVVSRKPDTPAGTAVPRGPSPTAPLSCPAWNDTTYRINRILATMAHPAHVHVYTPPSPMAVNNSETHPWRHLHGHDFWVLGYGVGRSDPATYNLRDPILKNTVAVHPYGWTALRWRADNPGMWAFPCHIEAHFFMGMGTVFYEGIEHGCDSCTKGGRH